MIANYKKIKVDLVYLQNHDIGARVKRVGVNMVPILQKDDSSYMAESLDIVSYLDNFDGNPSLMPTKRQEKITAWSKLVETFYKPLVYPRWMMITLPEFGSEEAKLWFKKNKSSAISMSFEKAISRTSEYLEKMNSAISTVDWLTLPSEQGNRIGYDDINFYPMLRNLTIVRNIKFPERVRIYLDEVTALTRISVYHDVAV